MHLSAFYKQFLKLYAKLFFCKQTFKTLVIITIASLLFFCTYVLLS